MQNAKFVQMAMHMKLAAMTKRWVGPISCSLCIVAWASTDAHSIAELLQETDPLPFIPEPKAQKSSQEMGQAIYQRPEFNAAPVSTATADDQSASALESVLADTFPEPRSKPQQSTP